MFSPPRHQGHQAQEKPQITQMNADVLSESDRVGSSSASSCRSATLSNAKAQRLKDAKSTQPPILPTDHTDRPRWFRSELGDPALPTTPSPPLTLQRRGAETQRRRESCRRLHRTARFRPSGDGREPLGQETAPKTSFRSNFLAQRPVLSEHRSRRFFLLFVGWKRLTLPSYKKEERQNRRANSTSAGEKTGRNGCLHPERSGFSPATGDLPIACRSAVNPRHHHPNSATTSLRFYGVGGWIWVYLCDLWAILGGSGFAAGRLCRDKWEALRLCGSAPLRSFWCSPLVSWCLGGSKNLTSLA